MCRRYPCRCVDGLSGKVLWKDHHEWKTRKHHRRSYTWSAWNRGYDIRKRCREEDRHYGWCKSGGIRKAQTVRKTIQELSQGLVQIEEGLRKFEELEKARGVSYKNDPRRVTLLRVKIRDTAALTDNKEEAKQLRNLIESASGACVTVLRETYPGVVIQIEDTRMLVQNYVKSAEFYKLQDKIKTRECS